MKRLSGKVVSVHAGSNEDLSKDEHASIQVELDGIVGDAHRSYVRKAWKVDKQPEGTIRRNERQWSAISTDELEAISEAMDLSACITAETVGANICLSGIPELSRLPKGTLLKFPSGVELMVEEFNPPCLDMGKMLTTKHQTRSGAPLEQTAFSKAAKLNRGIVGVVEAAGQISAGDDVTVELYESPSWLARSDD